MTVLSLWAFGAMVVNGYVRFVEPNLPVLYTEFTLSMLAIIYVFSIARQWLRKTFTSKMKGDR